MKNVSGYSLPKNAPVAAMTLTLKVTGRHCETVNFSTATAAVAGK